MKPGAVQYDVTAGSKDVGIITHHEDWSSTMSFEPLSPVEQAEFVLGEMDKMSEQYVIRRHGSYFRPNAAGYTASILEAGFYSRDEAETYRAKEGISIISFGDCLQQIEDELAAAQERVTALKGLKACLQMHQRHRSSAASGTGP